MRNATLARLLAATKLGAERASIERWMAAPSPLVLRPHTLLRGCPNAGLTNQIFSLVGCLVLASLSRATMVVPALSGGVGSGVELPFADVFDARHLTRALRGWVHLLHAGDELTPGSSVHDLTSDRGWFVYKAMSTAFGANDDDAPSRDLLRRIELRVLMALRPSRAVRDRAAALARQLGLGGGADGGGGFGCVHTRLERDMLRSVRFNRAGEPPALEAYLSPAWAALYPEAVLGSRTVFVPVGLNLRVSDEKKLRQPTVWNASIARTMLLTRRPSATHASTGHAGSRTQHTPATCDTMAALVDFTICRNASWFVGWSGSTYARLLGLYQKLDAGRGWFVACPHSACHVDAGRTLLPHTFCLEVEQQQQRQQQQQQQPIDGNATSFPSGSALQHLPRPGEDSAACHSYRSPFQAHSRTVSTS